MMMKLFKKNKEPLIMDCYTYSTYAYNHAKISEGKNYIPDWWKDTPKMCPTGPTIKNCRAFSEYYGKGIVVPLWGELEVKVTSIEDNKYEWRFSNKDFSSEQHACEQFQGFSQNKRHNIKLTSVWAIKMREMIYFTYTQPTWSQRDFFEHFTLLPGILEFKNQTSLEMNYIVCPKKDEITFRVPSLTPMAILHPMTERKIEIRHHLISKEDFSESILNYGAGMVFRDDPMPMFYKNRNKFWDKEEKINQKPLKGTVK